MTNIELIRMLIKHPPDAVVLAFDAEDGDYRAVTGCGTGPLPIQEQWVNGKMARSVYRIELQTDKPF